MVPGIFRGMRALRVANTVALGASLGGLTGSVIQSMFWSESRVIGAAAAVSTAFIGVLWSLVMRMRRRVTRRRVRLGWLLSIPLAMLNAGITSAVLLAQDSPRHPLSHAFAGAFAGITFGAVIWIPALIATLLLFGLPLARAQRLADEGLAGEERGERFVGVVCAALGLCAPYGITTLEHAPPVTRVLLTGLGILGVLAGTSAAVLATAREWRRRAFVAQAEAGHITGYRVDAGPEGKVLVRVETAGEGYRGAEHFEAVYDLAPDGAARRAL